jgi:hypothetical protein
MSKELQIIKDEYEKRLKEFEEKEAMLDLPENEFTAPIGLERRVYYLHRYLHDLESLIKKMEES